MGCEVHVVTERGRERKKKKERKREVVIGETINHIIIESSKTVQ